MKTHKPTAHLSRITLGALCFALSIGGCKGTNLLPSKSLPAATSCDPRALETCERSILATIREGHDPKPMLDAYFVARGERDSWTTVWKQARASGQTKAALVIERGSDLPADRVPTNPRLVRVDPLPSPVAMSADELLEIIGEAAGWEVVVRLSGTRVTEIFPRDPLAPFMAGLPPVVRNDGARARLEGEFELEAAIRRVTDHAASFRYLEAAREAERIEATLAARRDESETTLRAWYLLLVMAGAGIAFEPTPGLNADPPANPAFPDAAQASPYGDLLRVRASSDGRAAFRTVGERIIAALPEKNRAAFRALYAPIESCTEVPVGTFETPDELHLAQNLGRSLSPSLAATGTTSLGLATWLPKYEALVRTVDDTRTTWAHAFALGQERGEVGGISMNTTPTYRRVDALLSAHLAALSQLVQTSPDRVRLMSIVSLAYVRGIIASPPLRSALVDLLRRSVENRIENAPDVSALFQSTLAGALAATAYPQAIQSAVYLGLLGAFRDKLKRDFSQRTGWDVAGLFATNTVAGFFAGDPPNLDGAAAEISRALADPALSEQSLARLVSAAVRYLALAADGKLDPDAVDPKRWPAERKAAHAALRAAVAGLAEAKSPVSPSVIDDVTMLGDQTMTVVASVLAEKSARSEPVCTATDPGPSPSARRVFARIGDLRRKILANPSLATNEGAARVRFAVTILSDAVDVASRKHKNQPVAFTISDADAERAISAAFADGDLREALTSGYGILRRILAGFEAKGLAGADLDRARRLVVATSALFRDDAGASITLFDALAKAAAARAAKTSSADPPADVLLVEYARALRALGKPDQADLCLLGAMILDIVGEKPIGEEAIAATNDSSADLGWMMKFTREIVRARKGLPADPSAYASGMRAAISKTCEDPAIADNLVRVIDALRLASSGDRQRARETLEDVLAKAETQGLGVPRMSYKYEEKTTTKVITTSLDVSLGAGVLENSMTFQLGLGIRTPGKPEGSLMSGILPAGPERDVDALRYYVHVQSITALLHFLDGDHERGAAAAARVIEAGIFGVRLGGRAFGAADPQVIAKDARAVLSVVAVLAADAGYPLLAGDIWSLVRAALAPETDDHAIDELLDNPPLALLSVSSAKPPLSRAKRALRVVAEPLACTEQKVELGGYEAPACDEYPFALALRAGGALRKLPRLRRETGKACAASLSALDTFLTSVEKNSYDPDAFTRAVRELSTAGKTYEAAILLARQRQPSHCNQTIASAARTLGRSPALNRSLRADVLSVAVNCSLLDQAVLEDISAIDADMSMLADRGRNLSLYTFAAELGVTRDRWDVLGQLAKSPTFVSRWLDTNPKAALFAVVLAQAAAILAKEPALAETAASAIDLFCVKLPKPDAAACEAVEAMRRSSGSTGSTEQERIAKNSVAAALQRVSALRSNR